ncbi:MAG TPA: hypothetical protein PLU11_09370 [Chitinophagaceae bacterium]|nr:hypothetical protein [Chitinophagaceae bacterium]HPN59372.1 hypothetical protein [Chitinophagaceae bacterium]
MPEHHYTLPAFNSLLSFRPLVAALKKNIEEGNTGMKKLYGHVVKELESHPELMGTIHDLALLDPHHELIEELLSAVFPPTTANYMYGISYPFKNLAVYASPLFKKIMIRKNSNEILVGNDPDHSLDKQRLRFAYGLILKKYFGFESPENSRVVYPVTDEKTGLTRYMEMRLDGRFIDVSPVKGMPALPTSLLDPATNRLFTMEELMKMVPLEQFIFEGLTVLRINDVTEQAVITEMKNFLLDFNGLPGSVSYTRLEKMIQDLIGLKDLTIGITPFFRIQGHYIYSELHNSQSLLYRQCSNVTEKDEISDYSKILFRDNHQPVLYQVLDQKNTAHIQCLHNYYRAGSRSIIICPLKQGKELLGLLEISSHEPGYLQPFHISKIEPAVPLFKISLEKSLEQLNSQVEELIKKKFTAVQPAVEWKFTEVSLNYLVSHYKQSDTRLERIVFEQVYPFFGAIDVRNSSTARSKAVQADLLEQLELAAVVIRKAQQEQSFPILYELLNKIEKYKSAVAETLRSNEEMAVYDFLQGQLLAVFNHLLETEPAVKVETETYFASLDPQRQYLYRHRKEYEQSIARINETLARFVDREQQAAQKIYPHYFERFITDGLEFNMFMGQSISPRKKMDEIYLRNLKMWQLTMMVKAARVTAQLEQELPMPLRTTQLILASNQPLTICFRTEERKFDVDGVGNTRYEIIKKRIDKVHIRNSDERLTQPGMVAIVYTQAKDATEYKEYIEFLQHKELLQPGIESLDLEELQGVSGLKALRVAIRPDLPGTLAVIAKETKLVVE